MFNSQRFPLKPFLIKVDRFPALDFMKGKEDHL